MNVFVLTKYGLKLVLVDTNMHALTSIFVSSMDFFKKYINNKYFYTGLIFLVWMVFFDQENFIEQYRLSSNLDDLRAKKTYYQDEIANNEKAIYELENDSSQIEKFAREKYFMKRDNEEVFVIIKEED